EHAALGEVGLIGDEDVADPIGIRDFVDVLRPELEMDKIAVFSLGIEQELGGVAAEFGEDSEEGSSTEKGWGCGGGRHVSFSVYGLGSFGNFSCVFSRADWRPRRCWKAL